MSINAMTTYYKAVLDACGGSNTKQTYASWRKENIDDIKLSKVRRDSVKNNRLTAAELDNIIEEVKKNMSLEVREQATADDNKEGESHRDVK